MFSYWYMSIILVSHDIDELLLLADRIIVFEGPPLKIVEDISLSQTRPRSIDFLSDPDISKIKKTCLNLITREVV
jgi:ABC-type nitrate/sulfonate/bicarbonate transport system ATPase subunit